jgi:hypothetical protein
VGFPPNERWGKKMSNPNLFIPFGSNKGFFILLRREPRFAEKKGTFFDFAPLFFESGFAPLVGLSNEIKKLERPPGSGLPKKSFF